MQVTGGKEIGRGSVNRVGIEVMDPAQWPAAQTPPSLALQTEMWSAVKELDSGDLTDILKDLVSRGADPNLRGGPGLASGHSALHLAAMMDHGAWVPAFAAVGADLDAWNADHWTTAMMAAAKGSVSFLRALHGVDHNLVDQRSGNPNGDSLLHIAAGNSKHGALEFLLEIGCDPKAVNLNGSAVVLANALDPFILRLLSDAGADLDAQMRLSRNRVAHLVTTAGQAECFAILLDKGADLNTMNSTGHVPSAIALAGPLAPMLRAHLARKAAMEALVASEVTCTPPAM